MIRNSCKCDSIPGYVGVLLKRSKAISNPERFAEQRQWFGAFGQSTGRSRDWQCGAQAAEGGPRPGGWTGRHQLRLVVYQFIRFIPLLTTGFRHPRWKFGISEPSTVSSTFTWGLCLSLEGLFETSPGFFSCFKMIYMMVRVTNLV